MAAARYKIEKFGRNGYFGRWKVKIKLILGQQKAHKALLDPSTLPNIVTSKRRLGIGSYGTLVLNFKDNILI